mmetsp:Transcript_121507/g.343767  ORF Transcript_121507/g.343767 Transcript_121507/m.343767 type:complete len:217 (-) Transcript_121507:217-867(-)
MTPWALPAASAYKTAHALLLLHNTPELSLVFKRAQISAFNKTCCAAWSVLPVSRSVVNLDIQLLPYFFKAWQAKLHGNSLPRVFRQRHTNNCCKGASAPQEFTRRAVQHPELPSAHFRQMWASVIIPPPPAPVHLIQPCRRKNGVVPIQNEQCICRRLPTLGKRQLDKRRGEHQEYIIFGLVLTFCIDDRIFRVSCASASLVQTLHGLRHYSHIVF